jgi:hypothetical protein
MVHTLSVLAGTMEVHSVALAYLAGALEFVPHYLSWRRLW